MTFVVFFTAAVLCFGWYRIQKWVKDAKFADCLCFQMFSKTHTWRKCKNAKSKCIRVFKWMVEHCSCGLDSVYWMNLTRSVQKAVEQKMHPLIPLQRPLFCPQVSYFYLSIISRFSLPLNVFPALCSRGVCAILISILKSIERKRLISQPENHCFHEPRRI